MLQKADLLRKTEERTFTGSCRKGVCQVPKLNVDFPYAWCEILQKHGGNCAMTVDVDAQGNPVVKDGKMVYRAGE